MNTMSVQMREALQKAAKGPLRRVHDQEPGKPPWEHPPGSLAALVRRGFLEYVELRSRQNHLVQQWTVTDLGKEALKPPKMVGTEQPVYMARGAGTTSDWTRSIDGEELEGAPSEAWLRVSLVRLMASKDRREVARQLAKELRAA